MSGDDFGIVMAQLINERHSREVLAFETILKRHNRLEEVMSRLFRRIGETWRLIAAETDLPLARIESLTRYLGDTMTDEDGDKGEATHSPSKLYLSMYQKERELEHLHIQNEGLTNKLLETSVELASLMNANLLSRRIVENLPKYLGNNTRLKIPQIVRDTAVYRPHSGTVKDSSMFKNYLLTAADDGYAILADVPSGRSIEFTLNASVQACDLAFMDCHQHGQKLLVATCSGSSIRISVVSPCLNKSPTPLTHFTIGPSRPTSVCFVSSTRLALGTDDGSLRIYDFGQNDQPSSHREIRPGGWLLCDEGDSITCMAASSSSSTTGLDSRRLALTDSRNRIYVVDISTSSTFVSSPFSAEKDAIRLVVDGHPTDARTEEGVVTAVTLHPFDENQLAVTRIGGDSIDLLDISSSSPIVLRTLISSSSTHLTCAVAWQSKFPASCIVAGASDGYVLVWSTTSQQAASVPPSRSLPPPGFGEGPLVGALWGSKHLVLHNTSGEFHFYT